MLALQLLIIAGILLWIRFLWSRRQFYTLMLKVPGPIGLPFLGIAVETIMENREYLLHIWLIIQNNRKIPRQNEVENQIF